MPSVWVLRDDRPGNTNQSLGLAEALGWPYEMKSFHFSRLAKLHDVHDRLLDSTILSLDRNKSDSIIPPWPDIVIAAGRRLTPIARWIRKQSQGHTRLVQLGRKGGQVAELFDVVITPRYCRMFPHPRRIETLVPLNRVTDERLASESEKFKGLFGTNPKPHIALLVGGATVRHRFDADIAARLGRDVRGFAESIGGSVFALTSRRTGVSAVEVLQAELGATHVVYEWKAGSTDNPYWGCLALADILVVTGDSESMIGEAVAVGKPVYIYALPTVGPGVVSQWSDALVSRALDTLKGQAGMLTRLEKKVSVTLLEKGILRPLRDLSALHQSMFERGHAKPFGVRIEKVEGHAPLREGYEVAGKVKALLRF